MLVVTPPSPPLGQVVNTTDTLIRCIIAAILGVGLAFVWWKGDFDWLKRVVQEERVAPATGD